MSVLQKVVGLCVCVLVFSACQQERCKPAPDVSAVTVAPVKVKRFDQQLMALDSTRAVADLQALRDRFPAFADFYLELYGFWTQGVPDDSTARYLSGFVSATQAGPLYDTAQAVYGDLMALEAELTTAARYFAHYFPEQPFPEVIAMYSELSHGVIVPPTDTPQVVFSPEMFLGQDFPYYYSERVNMPRYITRSSNSDHLAAKILMAHVSDLVESADSVPPTTLLDHMILNGKKWYLLERLLPCTPDSVRWEYTADQTKWVKRNEFEMWREVFAGMLYDTDYRAFQKYVGLSPHSPNMPQEAPGNTGSYVGYRIVSDFMTRNPSYTLPQLLATTDAKKILTLSRYKPKR